MSNSHRFLVGRVALVIWASGFILVLSGCAMQDPFMDSYLRSRAEWDACKSNAGVTSAQSGAGLDATHARCFDQFMAQMDALRQAEEWMAARSAAPMPPGWADPYPVIPAQPSGSITLSPDMTRAGVYWVPGLPTEQVFVPGQRGGSITLTPDATSAGYYWVPGLPTERVFVPGQGGYLPPPAQEPWPLPKHSWEK